MLLTHLLVVTRADEVTGVVRVDERWERRVFDYVLGMTLNSFWRQQGNDTVSLAAISITMVDFLCLVIPDLLCS